MLLVAQTQGCDLSSEASCPLHGCPLLGPSSSAPGFLQPCDRGPTFQDNPPTPTWLLLYLIGIILTQYCPPPSTPAFYGHPIWLSYPLPAIHSSEQLTQLPHSLPGPCSFPSTGLSSWADKAHSWGEGLSTPPPTPHSVLSMAQASLAVLKTS